MAKPRKTPSRRPKPRLVPGGRLAAARARRVGADLLQPLSIPELMVAQGFPAPASLPSSPPAAVRSVSQFARPMVGSCLRCVQSFEYRLDDPDTDHCRRCLGEILREQADDLFNFAGVENERDQATADAQTKCEEIDLLKERIAELEDKLDQFMEEENN